MGNESKRTKYLGLSIQKHPGPLLSVLFVEVESAHQKKSEHVTKLCYVKLKKLNKKMKGLMFPNWYLKYY